MLYCPSGRSSVPEFPSSEESAMSSSFIFDSTENSAVYLGKTHGVEEENHTARLCVGICQCKLVEGSQETTEVQVWLTVEQVAELVKQFFWEIVSPGNIYTKLLQRLLHRHLLRFRRTLPSKIRILLLQHRPEQVLQR